MAWYSVKVEFDTGEVLKNGTTKKVKESFLVEGDFVSDVEARISKDLAAGGDDFIVKAVTETGYSSVIHSK